MSPEALSRPLDHDIREVVEGIFESMLHLPLKADGERLELSGECINAAVEFKGSWLGIVALCCTSKQARHYASRFLALSSEDLTDQLVTDVLGEIVNMIAGNLKSVFAHDLRLSLAKVVRGAAPIETPFQPTVQREVRFESDDGSFRVVVLAVPFLVREPWVTRSEKPSNS